MTRIKIEMEVDAKPIPNEDAWAIRLPYYDPHLNDRSLWKTTIKVAGIYCRVVGDEEPTESGYYKITYAGTGSKEIVFTNGHGHWFCTGSSSHNTWQELGNIVAVERIEL